MPKKLIATLTLLIITFVAAMAKDVMRYHRYTVENGLLQNYATTFAQDKDGYIWIGSRSGLCRFDGSRFTPFNVTKDGTKIGWVRKIRIGQDGHTLKMKINNQKFVTFNPKTREMVYTKPVDLGTQEPPKEIVSYDDEGLLLHHNGQEFRIPYSGATLKAVPRCENFIDRQGNLWVSFDNAVYQITFTSADYNIYNNVRDAAETIYGNDVRALLRLSDGTTLVASKDKRIAHYDIHGAFMGYLNRQGQWQTAPTEFLESAYKMVQDKWGRVWLGLRVAGLVCIENIGTSQQRLHQWTVTTTPQMQSDAIFDMYLSPMTSQLWIATWGKGVAVAQLKGDASLLEWQRPLTTKTEGDLKVRMITALGDTLAVCATTGLYLYKADGTLLSHVGDMDISSIVRIGSTTYVGGYGQGLFTLDAKNEIHPMDIPGLGDCIYSMCAMANDQIMIVNPDRMVLFDTRRGSVRYFDDEFFGMNMSFSEMAPMVDGQWLTMGLTGGLLQMPSVESHKAYAPQLMFDYENRTLGMGEVLRLRVCAMDYRLPRTVSYAWRERGTKEWNYLEYGEDEVDVSWFMPGKHVIEFRSTDATGIWTENITQVEIYVWPSWWQWMIIVSLLLAVAVIAVLCWKVTHPRHLTSSDTAIETATDIFPSAPDVTPYDRQLAQKLVECIESEIDNADFGVDQLAQRMGMSRSQLYSQCNETLDKTPATFILEIRLKRAMQLIEMRQMRVSEVAYSVGFTDPKYFTKVFKKRVGMTPTQYAASVGPKEDAAAAVSSLS